jgi:hypothetical protein
VQEMEALWPSSVGLAGAGVKPPDAALAEDCRGERSGKRPGLTRSGGDQEDVPEALGLGFSGWVCAVEASKLLDGIETGGLAEVPGMSLAAARVVGQVVSGV